MIENWPVNVRLTVDGQPVETGPDFRQGTERNADEVSSLVVWIRKQSTSPTTVVLSEPLAGDFDADGDIDKADLAELVFNWLARSAGYYPVKGNLNNDNRVNLIDFAIFASQWLEVY